MSFSIDRIGIGKCISVACIRISVVTLQNRHCIVVFAIFHVHNTGNSRRIIWSIRLKFSCTKCLLKCLLFVHQLINRIGLISVCHNRFVAKHTNRCINDQTRITQFRWVKRLCTDSVSILYKHAVSAVFTSSHDKICCHSVLSIWGFSDHDSSSRIRILFQFFFQ